VRSRSALPALAVALSLAACGCGRKRGGGGATADDATGAPSRFTGDPPALRVDLHGATFAVAGPGDYRSTVVVSSMVYETKEISESTSIHGTTALTLADDGAASGCIAADRRTHRSVSQYASGDGKSHASDYAHRSLLGLRGRWRHDAQGWTFVDVSGARGRCPAPDSPDGDAGTERITLRCVELRWGAGAVASALACSMYTGPLVDGLLDLGPIETPGWLLMGRSPGAAVALDQEPNAAPTLKLEAANVDVSPSAWSAWTTAMPPP
jgi:hypothetical protein